MTGCRRVHWRAIDKTGIVFCDGSKLAFTHHTSDAELAQAFGARTGLEKPVLYIHRDDASEIAAVMLAMTPPPARWWTGKNGEGMTVRTLHDGGVILPE